MLFTFQNRISNENISVLGCGWLGFPLAEALLCKWYDDLANKISKLEKAGIIPLISIETDGISGDEDFLKDSSILIIDIPPKLRGTNKENFVSKIEALIPLSKIDN
jgi:hypothetical protein